VAVPRGPRSGGLRRPDKARWNWAGGVLSRRPRSGRGEASLVAAASLGCRLSEGPGPPTGAVPDKAARRHALASHPPACGEGG
jgi:hypothetical protein